MFIIFYYCNYILKANIAAYPEDATIYVDYSFECGNDPLAVTGIAYLWESDPVKGMLAAPIYSTDEYRLPAAPWKFNLATQTVEDNEVIINIV